MPCRAWSADDLRSSCRCSVVTMGAVFSCCLKGTVFEELAVGGFGKRDNRRQTLQSLINDRDNPNVDGRKHCTPPPPIREEDETTPPSPSTGPGPAIGGRPDKPPPPKRFNYGGVTQQKSVGGN